MAPKVKRMGFGHWNLEFSTCDLATVIWILEFNPWNLARELGFGHWNLEFSTCDLATVIWILEFNPWNFAPGI